MANEFNYQAISRVSGRRRFAQFTAASKYLCITQGAVSGLINEMESQMEVSLFDRTSRVVKLSPDGEKFLPSAMRVVEEFQRAENYARDLKEIKNPGSGRRRAINRLCLLPQIIHAFKRQHPHTHVQLIDKPMSQLQKALCWGSGFRYRPGAAAGTRNRQTNPVYNGNRPVLPSGLSSA